mgnify:CR=1 FL=1
MKKLFFTLFLVIIAASQLYCQVVEHSSSFNNNVGVIDAQNNNVQSIHNNDFTPFAAPMPSQAPSGPMYVNPGEDPDEKDSVPVGSGALVLTLLGSAYFAMVGIRKNKKDKL